MSENFHFTSESVSEDHPDKVADQISDAVLDAVLAQGTGKVADEKLDELVRRHFDLRPKGIVQMLDVLRPIYRKTAAYGHLGREQPEFTWERTDKTVALVADC